MIYIEQKGCIAFPLQMHFFVAIFSALWFNIDSLFIKSWVRELARLIPRQPAITARW